jgi:AcrR family transcriptional regulator
LTAYLVVTKLAPMNATTRMTADERRDDVIAAATTEFAAGGYAGTSTQVIARRVGVSQPYLFQLFGTKKDLFVAAVRSCFAQTRSAFEETARETRTRTTDPEEILIAMGHRYIGLLRDRDMLRLQLHAYAACEDPEIQAVVREEWTALYAAVARVSGADDRALHAWFAEGMLLNVAASIGDLDSAVSLKLAVLGGALVSH